MNTKPLLHLILFLLSSYIGTVAALPDDRNQPIKISADSARIDEKSGTTNYIGNVVMTQGSMQIKADRIDLYRQARAINLIIAHGKPANFRQQPSVNKPVTNAFGTKMEYRVNKQTVTITGNARVEQQQDRFSGDSIVYQMDKAIVDAFSGKGKQGQRVEMIIHPRAVAP